MRLRPELVLLQKTMVTVEGVARRIDPGHDLWAAAEPVVRRWIARELSPPARVREFAREGIEALRAMARLAEAYVANTVVYTGTHDNDTTRGWFEDLPDGHARTFGITSSGRRPTTARPHRS